MIPPFDDSGFLPAGIHLATLNDIDTRFGQTTELRQVQMESVRWMIELAARVGIERIILNGSFVTDIMEPNDVDCVMLASATYPDDEGAAAELADGLPFLEIAVVAQDGFDTLVELFFATDRFGRSKGVVEVIQWN